MKQRLSTNNAPFPAESSGRVEHGRFELGADLYFRSFEGVPGHRPALADREQPDAGSLPHADLRPERGRRQVSILVLLARTEEGQEGHR